MSLLSPGVEVIEIDASVIAPTVSNSVAVFAGHFDRGIVGSYLLITNEADLVSYFGKPTIKNYNDWEQANSFLKYGNKLFLTRAANTNGSAEIISGVIVTDDVSDSNEITLNDVSDLKIGQYIAFGNDEGPVLKGYVITNIDNTNNTITVNDNVTIIVSEDDKVYSFEQSTNALYEAQDTTGTELDSVELVKHQFPIGNYEDFEVQEMSIAMSSLNTKAKFIARNPGNWGNNIEIAIAKASDFGNDLLVFEGIALDDLFEYAPTGDEIGIIIRENGKIVEVYTVSFDENARDQNNKSMYIEDVLNRQSSYVFVKDNTANDNEIKSYIYSTNGVITLVRGRDSEIQQDDLLNAYDLWSNKEEIDIDIIIANETDQGASAKALVDKRQDCICFIGANYGDCVGKKASIAVKNLVQWRKTGSINFNSMFTVACANYVYVYNKYLDKNVWINVAGHISGLRAQTSTNRASWWASAGLNRGQLKDIKKLAFNPDRAKRDILYKNGLNPIVSFSGQGIVMWGQKTLLSKPSSSNNNGLQNLLAA